MFSGRVVGAVDAMIARGLLTKQKFPIIGGSSLWTLCTMSAWKKTTFYRWGTNSHDSQAPKGAPPLITCFVSWFFKLQVKSVYAVPVTHQDWVISYASSACPNLLEHSTGWVFLLYLWNSPCFRTGHNEMHLILGVVLGSWTSWPADWFSSLDCRVSFR